MQTIGQWKKKMAVNYRSPAFNCSIAEDERKLKPVWNFWLYYRSVIYFIQEPFNKLPWKACILWIIRNL